jgi:5'-phosphate synthase pdxT subunit
MDLRIACLGEPDFPAVFIRAPLIIGVGAKVQVLASVAEGAVMARQENMLVTAFHPEIVDDSRVHRYFVGMVNGETTSTLSKIATYSNSPNVTAR